MLEEERIWSLVEICMIQELVSATDDLKQERIRLVVMVCRKCVVRI